MFRANYRKPRGFTLTEMLVVIGIIAILAALLLPAVNRAITTARNAAIAIEVNQLATAIEAYKQDKGDYPPNFRGTIANPNDASIFLRHIRKCYPKIDQSELATIIDFSQTPPIFKTAYQLDEGEALVFWLSLTRDDPRFPFGFSSSAPTSGFSLKKYYDFDQTRLHDGVDVATFQSYRAKFCKDSSYVYIDSRSYDVLTSNFPSLSNNQSPSTTPIYAFAEDSTVQESQIRPYWSDNTLTAGATAVKDQKKPVNPTTFQIICAGQDGDFGLLPTDINNTGPKQFMSGLNYNPGDKDNITNFSNGKTLADNVPQ
jgi:prepilin-type N-terminal cleavage/methylation domain-containing protein